jgi:plastocyanin
MASPMAPISPGGRRAGLTLRAAAELLCWLALLGPLPAWADATYAVDVRDQRGAPVRDAVLALVPRDPAAVPPPPARSAVMDQRRKQFVPHVLAVQVGTPVVFPNSDDIRHHVYSFSPAKTFQLKLYKGIPAAPVVFDRPGTVVLGCNIHDPMVGYIYVLPTRFFATTGEAGQAELSGLPAGRYEMQIWHPRLVGEGAGPHVQREVELPGSARERVTIPIELRDAEPGERELTPLEQKFKSRAGE